MNQPHWVILLRVPPLSLRVQGPLDLATLMHDPTKPGTIAGRLALLFGPRKAAGELSYEKIADELGVSLNKVGKWFRGEIEKERGLPSVPDAHELVKLARLFGVSTDYLCCNTDESGVLRVGHFLVDQQITEQIMRASRWRDAEPLARKKTWFAEIPPRARVLSPTDFAKLRAELGGRLRELKRRKGGGSP